MPRVRCMGCNGEYELDVLTEDSPLCPVCNERHPIDGVPVETAGPRRNAFSWLAIALGSLVACGLAVGLLWPTGEVTSGEGRDALPVGPFTTSGPWTLRWNCDVNPRIVYLYQHVEGEAEPKRTWSFGKHKSIPKIGEREIDVAGEFTVSFHEQFNGSWTVTIRE